MSYLFRLFSRLPLPLVHALGAVLGLLALLRGRHRALIRENLATAGLDRPAMLMSVGMEFGKGMLELPLIWLRPYDEILSWVREVHGWEHVEAAHDRGRGTLLLGPHLGCLELAGLYLASRLSITALYSRPRQEWVHEMMQEGRNRGGAHMVEPNLKGVRALLNALKRNEAAWVLPDQSTNDGEGRWMRFFGRWAYMPTLLYRLQSSAGAATLIFVCERLSWGRGYRLWIDALPDLPADQEQAALLVNNRFEAMIRRIPSQYLWTYRLYRTFRNVPPPPKEG